jgi:hypothetical protein
MPGLVPGIGFCDDELSLRGFRARSVASLITAAADELRNMRD